VTADPAPPRPASVDTDALISSLREHTAGLPAGTAAIDLLARHRTWLSRPDFHHHIHLTPTTGIPVAWIDWPAAVSALGCGQLPCATSEAAVLRIAAALGADLPVHLHQLLGGLDRHTIALVTTAITDANGA
jgi:hypothetical protein